MYINRSYIQLCHKNYSIIENITPINSNQTKKEIIETICKKVNR